MDDAIVPTQNETRRQIVRVQNMETLDGENGRNGEAGKAGVSRRPDGTILPLMEENGFDI